MEEGSGTSDGTVRSTGHRTREGGDVGFPSVCCKCVLLMNKAALVLLNSRIELGEKLR